VAYRKGSIDVRFGSKADIRTAERHVHYGNAVEMVVIHET